MANKNLVREVTGWAVVVCIFFLEVASAQAQGGDAVAPASPDLRAKGLILVKVYCLIIVFFATFLGGISPYFFRWNQAFLVLGTQFAGGVFLATALIHFLGDSHNTFLDLTTNPYAFAEMLAVAGYLLTMLGDVVIKYVYSKRPVDTSNKSDMERAPAPQGVVPVENPAVIHTENYGDAVLLVLALCFHSVFEGIAIGIADTKGNAWKALWTVSLHKVFAAIAMGIALLRIIPNRALLQCILYAFAFAISTPIGVAIGIIIDSTVQGDRADWTYAIAMGLATGVFVYVAINHLLGMGYVPPHKVAVDRPSLKFLAVLLGCTLIAVVMIWG